MMSILSRLKLNSRELFFFFTRYFIISFVGLSIPRNIIFCSAVGRQFSFYQTKRILVRVHVLLEDVFYFLFVFFLPNVTFRLF